MFARLMSGFITMFISLCMLIFATVVTTTRTHEQLTSMSIKGEIFALIEPRHSYAGIVESNAVTTLPKKKKRGVRKNVRTSNTLCWGVGKISHY